MNTLHLIFKKNKMKKYKFIPKKYSNVLSLGRLTYYGTLLLIFMLNVNSINAQNSSGYQTAVYGKTDKDKYKPPPIMVCANDTTVVASTFPCSASVVLNLPMVGPLCPPTTGPTLPPLPFPPSPYSGSVAVTWKLAYGDGDTVSCIQHVTVTGPTVTTTNITSCDSYTWAVNGQTYIASGVYTYTTINPIGCPASAVLNLTINSNTTSTSNINACDTYTWPASGLTYTASGMYTSTSLTAGGCVLTSTLNLIIDHSSTNGNATTTACGFYLWNGNTYTASGVYTYQSLNAQGCTNTATLNLTINPNTNIGDTTVYACASYTWPATGLTYTSNGVYTKTSLNANGCVNTATLAFIIPTLGMINTNFAFPDTAFCIGSTISATTQMPSPNTGPTLVNQWLIYNANSNCVPNGTAILTNYGNTFSAVLNSSQFLPGHCYVLQHGIYSDCLGYSSTIKCFCIPPATSSLSATACNSYTWAANGLTYTSSGVYTHSSLTPQGCSLLSTLNLTMNSFYDCYCNSIAFFPNGQQIYNVTIAGASTNPLFSMSNACTTTAPGPGSLLNQYSNFKTLGSLVTMSLGSTNPLAIAENECGGGTLLSISVLQSGLTIIIMGPSVIRVNKFMYPLHH